MQDISWHTIFRPVRFLVTIIMILFCVCLLWLPILLVKFVEEVLEIEYNKYIEILGMLLNSWYIVVVAILCVIFYFRKEFSEKIMQITSVKDFLKFKSQNDNTDIEELIPSKNTIIEKCEENEIEKNIKKEFLPGTTTKVVETSNKIDEVRLENENLILENIRLRMAKTTEYVLKSIYIEKRMFKTFSIADIEKYIRELKQLAPNIIKKGTFKKEVKTIVFFLSSTGIIETEDELNYEVTDFGRKFIRYIFEGGI